ncbi:hypothetical protein NT017_16410 [Prolixibacter sp. NT017]|nr:hypothetical protein NT017_16410 [Prolixibacter sp. NT017]
MLTPNDLAMTGMADKYVSIPNGERAVRKASNTEVTAMKYLLDLWIVINLF